MRSIRAFVIFWLSGVIAGVVLMERWRRHGGRYVPAEPEASAFSSVPVASAGPAGQPNVVRLVVTGAKLDAERVRQRLRPNEPTPGSVQAPGTSGAESSSAQ